MFGLILAIMIVIIVTVLQAFDLGSFISSFGGGGGRTNVGVGGGVSIGHGAVVIPIIDSDYREGDITAVDTWTALTARDGVAQGGVSIVKEWTWITSMQIQIAVTAAGSSAAGELHGWYAAKMSGTGLAVGGSYRFLAHGMVDYSVGTGDGLHGSKAQVVTYPLAVPTKGSGTIDIEGFNGGEDLGTTTMSVTLTFASIPTPGGYIDSDLREADLTAVDTLVGMTAIGATTYGAVDVPMNATQLNAVVTQIAPDPGTSAAQVGFIVHGTIQGTGMAAGGTYRFPFPSWSLLGFTGGGVGEIFQPEFVDTEIAIKPGGKLDLSATMIGTDPGACTVAMCLLWR